MGGEASRRAVLETERARLSEADQSIEAGIGAHDDVVVPASILEPSIPIAGIINDLGKSDGFIRSSADHRDRETAIVL